MRHRIRAAGILVDQDRILMVNENDDGRSYWVPPGGGFETQDGNTRNTVKREVWEETGLLSVWASFCLCGSLVRFPEVFIM